jgi:hypothetical protein
MDALVLADPWYDYLAFPIAPLVLVGQVGAMFTRRRALRLAAAVACPMLLTAMFFFVAEKPDPAEGANIGAGVMLLWLLVSAVLLLVALGRELVGLAVQRARLSGR